MDPSDFRNANIGINRNDNYMTLFMSMFHPPQDGAYRFRCTDKDDRATIWLDMDRDGVFELTGDNGTEFMGGIENFTSSTGCNSIPRADLTRLRLLMGNGEVVQGYVPGL